MMQERVSILCLVLGLGVLGCKKKEESDQKGDGSELTIIKKVASVKIGESDMIKINITPKAGKGVNMSAAIDLPYATATIDGNELTITGVSLGIANVTVTNEDEQTSSVEVRVYDPKYLDIGGVLLGFTTKFTGVWGDGGSGANMDGSFWHPVAPEGFYTLGSFAEGGYGDPSNSQVAIVLKDINDSGLLAEPTDYEQIWNDGGSGADADGSMWKPIAPAGFVCLGTVAQAGYAKPETSRIRCVAESLTVQGAVGSLIWNDAGSGANTDFASWNINPPEDRRKDMAYLSAGGFQGFNTHATPEAVNFRVLMFKLPITTSFRDATIAPTLDSYDEPEAESDLLLARYVSVPFVMVSDSEKTLAWRVANSPIYQLQMNSYYKKLLFHDNRQGTSAAVDSKADTIGVTTTQTDTYSQTWGVTISAETGVSLGVGSKVSVSLSYEYGYESSSSLENLTSQEVTKTLETPPGSAAALWQKVNRFQLMRTGTNGLESVGNPWEIAQDSYVSAVYPR